jgi:hypothetical protein
MVRFTRTLALSALISALAAAPALAAPRTAAARLSDRWVTTKIEAEYFLDLRL